MASARAIAKAESAPIERVGSLAPEAFREAYEYPGRPVILTDIARSWPAARTWTPEYLAARCGDELVDAEVSESGRFRYNVSQKQRLRFKDLLAAAFSPASAGPRWYLRFKELWPELAADVEFPRDLVSTRAHRSPGVWLFIGPPGVVTDLHQDAKLTLFAQIAGKKRWTLYSPADTARLYRYPFSDHFEAHRSQVDPFAPDLERHPRFAEATRMEFVLHPGEVLFLPPFWWHAVEGIDPTISLNLTYHRSRRDLSRYWREYARCAAIENIRKLRRRLQPGR